MKTSQFYILNQAKVWPWYLNFLLNLKQNLKGISTILLEVDQLTSQILGTNLNFEDFSFWNLRNPITGNPRSYTKKNLHKWELNKALEYVTGVSRQPRKGQAPTNFKILEAIKDSQGKEILGQGINKIHRAKGWQDWSFLNDEK